MIIKNIYFHNPGLKVFGTLFLPYLLLFIQSLFYRRFISSAYQIKKNQPKFLNL